MPNAWHLTHCPPGVDVPHYAQRPHKQATSLLHTQLCCLTLRLNSKRFIMTGCTVHTRAEKQDVGHVQQPACTVFTGSVALKCTQSAAKTAG